VDQSLPNGFNSDNWGERLLLGSHRALNCALREKLPFAVFGSVTLQVVPVEFQVAADCTLEIVASAGTEASRTVHKRTFFTSHLAGMPA
jgi:hypothetical protein